MEFFRILDLNLNFKKKNAAFLNLIRFFVSCISWFQTLISRITKKILVKIFQKSNTSSMQTKFCNSVHENNWSITNHEQDALTHFKPMLYATTRKSLKLNVPINQGRIQRFWKEGALYVGQHDWPAKKF